MRDTIEELERALRAGDPAAVCGLYADGQDFCREHFGPRELRSVGFGGEIEVREVEVDGDLATVRVENVRGERRVAGTATLRKVGDDWRLSVPGR